VYSIALSTNEWNLCATNLQQEIQTWLWLPIRSDPYPQTPCPILFFICCIRLPKYRWLGLEEFFRKYHFIKTHDEDNKNENNNDKFCGRQTDQKDRKTAEIEGSQVEKKEKLGSCCRAAASWSNELKLKDKHFNNIEPGEQRSTPTTCN